MDSHPLAIHALFIVKYHKHKRNLIQCSIYTLQQLETDHLKYLQTFADKSNTDVLIVHVAKVMNYGEEEGIV